MLPDIAVQPTGTQRPRNVYFLALHLKTSALQLCNDKVETGQEAGSVARLEHLWTAGDLSGRSQIIHQIPGCKRHADGIVIQYPSARGNHIRPRFDATACKRDIRGDDDAAGRDLLRNPIVNRIGPTIDNDTLDERLARGRNVAIADQEDVDPIPVGDAIDLPFHWAGIGVDIEPDRIIGGAHGF